MSPKYVFPNMRLRERFLMLRYCLRSLRRRRSLITTLISIQIAERASAIKLRLSGIYPGYGCRGWIRYDSDESFIVSILVGSTIYPLRDESWPEIRGKELESGQITSQVTFGIGSSCLWQWRKLYFIKTSFASTVEKCHQVTV